MPRKTVLVLFLLLLLVCLAACVGKKGEQLVNQENNPFANMGLLTHPGETPEELLVRAHLYDPDAKLAVTAGYILGIGGFPQDEELAYGWYAGVRQMFVPYTDEFLTVMGNAINTRYRTSLKETCYDAERSMAAPLFKNAGLFDVVSWCTEEYGNSAPYVPGKDGTSADFFARDNTEVKNFVTELIDRPMTELEKNQWACRQPQDWDALMSHYIIRAKKNELAHPQQGIVNLLRFIKQRRSEEPSSTNSFLSDVATNALMRMNYSEEYTSAILELIRKAHAGDAEAALKMADNYRTGGMGFVVNIRLAHAWLKRGADLGGKKSLDALTSWSYAGLPSEDAWQEAQLGMRYGSANMRDVFAWIIKETEKNFKPETLQELQQELEKKLKALEASGYQTQ